jgi:hypothetical protein
VKTARIKAVHFFLASSVVLAALVFTGQSRRALDPREPIAADGSLTAGRALTLADQEPPKAPVDLDDPTTFERVFSRSSIGRSRDAVLEFIELPASAICEPDRRQQLIAAIRLYKADRKYLSTEFHFRGPRASKFIDQAWTSEKDLRIEGYMARLVQQGYLRASEVSSPSFFRDIFEGFGTNPCSRS